VRYVAQAMVQDSLAKLRPPSGATSAAASEIFGNGDIHRQSAAYRTAHP
jgi:hypothetical protein